ncbi:hypothetical protein XM47_17215 [Catenovulum maritimum]|uniref:Sulfatase N-terminal domain-containing protein n=1 Tax=Catenovulum maritimum TaxID=1513271 RepID=A0A0J8GMB4_9ALTE|nr:hypothetical protein XM47_17215 [Catenovulum maritimum]
MESATQKTEENRQLKQANPNVIIIVADQMRRASMGFWQQEKFRGALNGRSDYVVTPNLDKLANEGIVFTEAISNYPLCSPFRGMLMSGMFPHNNGVTNNTRIDRPTVGLRPDITSLTEVLNQAGYNTALVGKGHWHNNLPLFDNHSRYVGTTVAPGGHFMKGTKYDTFIPPGPGRQGIEYWYQTLGHNHDSPMVYTNDTKRSGVPEGHPYFPKRYSAVDQADVIIDYLNNTHQQRQVDKPFSILWTMDPPHSPYQAMEDTDEAIYNQYYKDLPIETLLNRPNVNIERAKKYARIYFSMVTIVDREIGRILDELKSLGLDENTLIVFTSDHGEMMGSHSKMTKNVFYEESLAIPLIIHQPQKLKPQIQDLLIGVPDFMPTILGLLDLEDKIPDSLDGLDYSPLLLNKKLGIERLPKSSLYYGAGSKYGVKTHKYTYVVSGNGELAALFNNLNDPYQLTPLNFADIPTQDVNFLKQQLGYWLKKTNHDWFKARKYPSMIAYP